MEDIIIKNNNRRPCRLIKFLKKKKYYEAIFIVTKDMLQVDDSCDPGWSKFWGVAFGLHQIHSSYRVVFRIKDKKLKLGYYAYINGVSPQDEERYKGDFKLGDVSVGSKILMRIYTGGFTTIIVKNLSNGEYRSKDLPSPKRFLWLRTELLPHIKCKRKENTTFIRVI